MIDQIEDLNKIKGMSFLVLRMLLTINKLGPMDNKRLGLELGISERTVTRLKGNAVRNNLLVAVNIKSKRRKVHDVSNYIKLILQ